MTNNTKNIYQTAIQAAERGMKVTVRLPERTLQVDSELLIDAGRHEGELGFPRTDEDTALGMIEDAYVRYRQSIPDGAAITGNCWFRAKSWDELSDRELVTGEKRSVARCRLETTLLMLILNGSLSADSPAFRDKWFWQSSKYKELIILTNFLK